MQNLYVLNIPQSLSQTHVHTAYWSLERAVVTAATSLSSAEVTGKIQTKKKKQHSLTCQKEFHINMELRVNRSHQQTVKLRETSTQLSQVFCSLIFGSIRRIFLLSHWCCSLTESKVCSLISVRTIKIHNDLLNRGQSSRRGPLLYSYPHLAVLSERETQKSVFTMQTAIKQQHNLQFRHVTVKCE